MFKDSHCGGNNVHFAVRIPDYATLEMYTHFIKLLGLVYTISLTPAL